MRCIAVRIHCDPVRLDKTTGKDDRGKARSCLPTTSHDDSSSFQLGEGWPVTRSKPGSWEDQIASLVGLPLPRLKWRSLALFIVEELTASQLT